MDIPVPWDAKPGDLIECENCAGVRFRLFTRNGRDALQPVQLVSCSFCGEKIQVDDDTPEGTVIHHGEAAFRLDKEFGAFSLELCNGESPGCVSPQSPGSRER